EHHGEKPDHQVDAAGHLQREAEQLHEYGDPKLAAADPDETRGRARHETGCDRDEGFACGDELERRDVRQVPRVMVAFVHTQVYKYQHACQWKMLRACLPSSRRESLQWRFRAAISFAFLLQAAAERRSVA